MLGEFAAFSVMDQRDSHTGSKNSIALVKKWLETCIQHHDTERCPPEVSVLPTRVLDVGITGQGETVRLNVPDGSEKALYIALSHCWGPQQIITTTRANLAEHRDGIALTALPRTFQEAIHVTRELNVRYLWIDGLCIIQDSMEDWESEAAIMADVYRNALLTMLATKARSGIEGCFAVRDGRVTRPCKLGLTFEDGRPVYIYPWKVRLAVRDGPLYDRAWVYQEKALSRRCIDFTTGEVLWSCPSLKGNESDPAGQVGTSTSLMGLEQFVEAVLRTPADGRPYVGDDKIDRDDPNYNREGRLRNLCYHAVSGYASGALTVSTDRLPAISALVSILHPRLRVDRYVAGLWRDDLARGLLWSRALYGEAQPTAEPGPYVAPSWSWASMPAGQRIDYAWMLLRTRRKDWSCYIKLSSVEVQMKGKNPYGEVMSGAALVIDGLVAPISVADALVCKYSPIDPFSIRDISKRRAALSFDTMQSHSVGDQVALLAIIGFHKDGLDTDQFKCHAAETLCVIIEPAPESGPASVSTAFMEKYALRTSLRLV